MTITAIKSLDIKNNLQSTSDLSDDECELLNVYRRAKKIKNSEITIAVHEGKRIKLWLTEKRR